MGAPAGRRIIPILGIRKPEQLQDLLGSLDIELSAEHLARLDEVSRIELGFPYERSSEDPRARWSTATSSRRSTCRRHPTDGIRRRHTDEPCWPGRPRLRHTVSYHLHKVYAKLGITSRAELGQFDLDDDPPLTSKGLAARGSPRRSRSR